MDGAARDDGLVHQRSFPQRSAVSPLPHVFKTDGTASFCSTRWARFDRARVFTWRLAKDVRRRGACRRRRFNSRIHPWTIVRDAQKADATVTQTTIANLVIGGGPAGSMLALRLADSGRPVPRS